MVAKMDGELPKQFLQNTSYFIMSRLKEMFQEQTHFERHKVTMDLISYKIQEGSSISTHVLKMMSMIAQLKRLDSPVTK
jgi:gag-polypeptide of LTR copia-type